MVSVLNLQEIFVPAQKPCNKDLAIFSVGGFAMVSVLNLQEIFVLAQKPDSVLAFFPWSLCYSSSRGLPVLQS